jgi:hypothetical protein
LRGDETEIHPKVADSPKSEKITKQKQYIGDQVRGDEGPAFKVRQSEWLAINEITDKLTYQGAAIAWTMQIRNKGWFGRVRDDRGQWSFGPSSRHRARNAAEAWIKHEPFEKLAGERTFSTDCMHLL